MINKHESIARKQLYRSIIRNILSYAFDIPRNNILIVKSGVCCIYCKKDKTEYIAKVLNGQAYYGIGTEDAIYFSPINIFK